MKDNIWTPNYALVTYYAIEPIVSSTAQIHADIHQFALTGSSPKPVQRGGSDHEELEALRFFITNSSTPELTQLVSYSLGKPHCWTICKSRAGGRARILLAGLPTVGHAWHWRQHGMGALRRRRVLHHKRAPDLED